MGEDATGPYETPSGNLSRRRVSVDEAARELGLSVDAVRKRVQRGTIEHEKDAAGRVRILLDSPDNASTVQDESPDAAGHDLIAAKDETISGLREQVAYLQGVIATRDRELTQRGEEIRRRDQALEREQELAAMFADRLRQLEAPRDEQNQAESAESRSDRVEETPQEVENGAGRPWWRRWFGS